MTCFFFALFLVVSTKRPLLYDGVKLFIVNIHSMSGDRCGDFFFFFWKIYKSIESVSQHVTKLVIILQLYLRESRRVMMVGFFKCVRVCVFLWSVPYV